MIRYILDFLWICSSLVPYIIFFIIGLESNQFYVGLSKNYVLSISVLLLGILVTWIVLKCYLCTKTSDSVQVSSIRPAEPTYIPVYISYFIITLGITEYSVFFVITFLLVLFIFKTKVFYFNVLAYIFGYHFYEVTSNKGISLMLILKEKDIKQATCFENLIRLNNFSFIEGGKQ